MEEGKKEYEFEQTNIAPWLHQTIDVFSRECIQKGIKIKSQIPDHLPRIKIDRNALAQSITNLLDNAVKFSSEKKEVHVIVIKQRSNLVIQVKDHGIGIPREDLNKIFEKFYQGKNALKYSVKGTGLGLTLVKHTVEAHGGKVTVESQVGHGSTFSLILPIENRTD
jgi:signal transduction histidine kinase